MNEVEQLKELLKKLRALGHDIRVVYDVPKGTISFQGVVKYEERS